MRVLKVFKHLEDVVIYEDDKGNLGIRSMYQDEGTEEERAVIKEKVMSEGFKVNHSVTLTPTTNDKSTPGV